MSSDGLQEFAEQLEDQEGEMRHRKVRFGVPPKKHKTPEVDYKSQFEAENILKKFIENNFKNPSDPDEQKRLGRYKEWIQTSLDQNYLEWDLDDFESSYKNDVSRIHHKPSGLGAQHEGEENKLLDDREAEDDLGRLLDIHVHQWKVASPKFREEFGLK